MNDKLSSAYIDFKRHGMLEGIATTDALHRLLSSEDYNPLPPIPQAIQQSHSPDYESILSEVILAKGHGA